MDDQDGFEFEVEPDLDGSLPVIPEDTPPADPQDAAPPAEPPKNDYVSKADYDRAMEALAELRGRFAALSESGQRIREPEPPKQDNSAGEAALKARLKGISEKLYDPDRAEEGLRELLEVNAIINRATTQQEIQSFAGPSMNSAADLIIENFMGRQERKDDLYDKVAPLIEEQLKKVDKAQIARMPREQVLEGLNTMYEAARGKVLGKMYEESRARAKSRPAAAPNLGGGGNNAPVADARAERISKAQRELALAAGFKEDELADIFKEESDDQW